MFGIVWIVLGVVRTIIIWFVIWISISCYVIVIGTIISGAPLIEPHGSSSAVLSELCLGVGHAGICAPNAMPGIDPAFLEFLVLWVTVLVMV